MFAQRLHRLSLFRGKCHGVTHRVIATMQLCTRISAYVRSSGQTVLLTRIIERVMAVYRISLSLPFIVLFLSLSLSLSHFFFETDRHARCISNLCRRTASTQAFDSILIIDVRVSEYFRILPANTRLRRAARRMESLLPFLVRRRVLFCVLDSSSITAASRLILHSRVIFISRHHYPEK